VGLIQANVRDLHDGLLFGVHGRGKYMGLDEILLLLRRYHILLLSVVVLSL
jgi:hypothetical protein